MNYPILFRLLSLFAMANDLKPIEAVTELRWEYRLIIAHTEKDTESWLAQFSENKDAIAERHICYFVISEDSIKSNDPRVCPKPPRHLPHPTG